MTTKWNLVPRIAVMALLALSGVACKSSAAAGALPTEQAPGIPTVTLPQREPAVCAAISRVSYSSCCAIRGKGVACDEGWGIGPIFV